MISNEDVVSLQEFGLLLKSAFAVNLAKGATLIASNVRGNNKTKFGPAFLLDNDRYSYWATDDGVTNPSLIIDLHRKKTFNIIRLRENIKLGQRIDSVAIDILVNKQWQQIAAATSIGANRLIRLDKFVKTNKVRLRVTGAAVSIALSDFGLYREVRFPPPVVKPD
jgi:alpha-L-fucosidase